MKRTTFQLPVDFSLKGLQPKKDETVVFLSSNGQGKDLFAIGEHQRMNLRTGTVFSDVKESLEKHPDWWFGYLGYDLKNELENLHSKNVDGLNFPEAFFFRPVYVVEISKEHRVLHSLLDNQEAAIHDIKNYFEPFQGGDNHSIHLNFRTTKEDYLKAIEKLKYHIKRGDIYEANYCHELFAENSEINPFDIYSRLIGHSPTPFSAYVQSDATHIMCSSPERFLKKEGKRLLSQPIKGTRPRGRTPEQDIALKNALSNSEKDRRENVMIVDMVRNDLSRSAARNTVKVDELFGIYAFPQVFQMISTISAELKEGLHPVDAIANAFPMGSMTGTPKIRAMELIEEYEDMKRGLYSGTIGYFTPELDFDFNVVIRSLLYNSENCYLSACVGGAITDLSDPEEEFEETMVKASALRDILQLRG